MTSDALLYRDFYYPLNVFMHVLTHEEGRVDYLHYGFFEQPDDTIGAAQERSTSMLLERLPPPPARLLEVGIGLATTLRTLTRRGYEAEGITPDEKQIAMVRARHGDALRIHCSRFETFEADRTYDVITFQESSQYIGARDLFRRAELLAPRVIVLDEFALKPLDQPGSLHSLDEFLAAATNHRFHLAEKVDVSSLAAPTVTYFMERIPHYRERLIRDLGITREQVDDLYASGQSYLDHYARGVYGYFILDFVTTT